MSDYTANLIIASGKQMWVEARPDAIHLKGKGSMKTYFLRVSGAFSRAGSVIDKSEGATEVDWAKASVLSPSASVSNQTRRLVEWNTESLLRLLQHVVASRGSSKQTKSAGAKKLLPTHAPLEEVVEVIALPQFNLKTACNRVDPETIDLGPAVKEQLYSYISWLASAYKTNPFHNFEHARYVPAFKPMLM